MIHFETISLRNGKSQSSPTEQTYYTDRPNTNHCPPASLVRHIDLDVLPTLIKEK